MAKVTIYCPKHPKWKMIKPPTSACPVCWTMWNAVTVLKAAKIEL